jgi:hypothetical protein
VGYDLPGVDQSDHHRIGERHTLHETGAAWRVPQRTRFRPAKMVEVPIVIDNLSVTGAGVQSAANSFVRLGQVVELRLGQHWGRVQVMRCRETDDPQVRYWGVEFVESSNEFLEELSARLAAFSAVHEGQVMRDWDD